jgi:hypothetical protein
MLTPWLKRLVLAAALAVMPLQGVAATLSVLLCHGEAQAHSSHAGDGHDHSAQSDSHHAAQQPADDNAGSGAPYHLCCHFTASAPATMTPQAVSIDFPTQAYTPEPLHDLFVPDRPQRPPLA